MLPPPRASNMHRIVRYFIWMTTLVGWFIVANVFFWPLLARAVALNSALIVLAMLRPRPMHRAEREMQRVADFWSEGLARVNSILKPATRDQLYTPGLTTHDLLAIVMWAIGSGTFWVGTWAAYSRVSG
jgi:hypothetical protein